MEFATTHERLLCCAVLEVLAGFVGVCLLGFFFLQLQWCVKQREVILFGMDIYFGIVAGLHCSLYHHKGPNF